MGQLELSFLGAPAVRHDGEAVNFRTRKALALLAYLAVEEGMHTREKLAAILWPENDASSGRANLRNALVHLRRPLRHNEQTSHLHVERDALGFNRDADFSSDWRRLQEAAGGGTAALLQEVVDAYRGDFLEGFTLDDAPAFDDWAALRREQAHRQMETVFDRLSQLQAEGGQTEAAIATCERWLQHNPLNEAAYRRLMRLHLAAGNQAAARAAYEQYRTVLARELDAAPSPATEALAEQARKEPPQTMGERAGGSSPALQPATTSPSLVPLIGREAEHRQLVAAFHAARRSRPQVVVLAGEAGVGKTRLAAEFLDWAAAKGADVLHGRAFETGGRLTYQPLVSAVRPRVEVENAPEDLLGDVWLTELSRLLPELRERYPDLPRPAGGDKAARARLFEAVARLVAALAQRAPAVLFVDDVQWADAATLDLLQYAAGRWREEGAPILLLLARRTEGQVYATTLQTELQTESQKWLERLARETALTEIALEALSREEVQDLVQRLAPEETAAAVAGFARWLFAETGGQPFYVGEMVEALLEEGWLEEAERGLDLSAATDEEGRVRDELRGFLPPGVHRVIRARLARLSPEAFTLATAGAVLGQTFSFDRLCRVAGAEEMASLPALDALLQSRIFAESGGRQPYAFAHDKIRDVVYTEAGDARRRLFHRRALDALAEAGEAPAELAHHARRAGRTEAAVRHSITAGDAAMNLFAVRDAAAYYEEARQTLAEHADATLPPEPRLHVCRRLGRAYDILGAYARAEGVYRDMAEMARNHGDRAAEVVALNRTATMRAYQHDYESAAALLEETLPLAKEAGDRRALAETHWNLAQMGNYGGDPSAMEAHATRALTLARELGDGELIARCLNSLAYDARNRLRPLEAIDYAGEALERYRALGDRALEADCLGVTAQAEMLAGRPRAAAEHARAALEISREIESEHGVGFNAPMLILALLDGGRYGEAVDLIHQFLTEMEPPAEVYEHLMTRYVASAVYRVLLDAERVIAYCDEGLAQVSEGEAVLFQMDRFLQAGRAEAHALRGAWVEACRDAREALPVENVWLLFLGQHRWWLHVDALLRGGEEAAAGELVDLLAETAETAARLAVPHRRAQATAARWDGNLDEAAEHLEEAAALAEEMGLPGERWQALAAAAGLAAERGEEEQAAALRGEAVEIVKKLAERIDDEMVQQRFAENAKKLLREPSL